MIFKTHAAILFLFCSLQTMGQDRKFASEELQEAASLLATKDAYSATIYQFVENYINQLLSLSPQERNRKMEIDDMVIESGGLDKLNRIGKRTRLTITTTENRYWVTVDNDNYPIIRLSFPASYQLITQKNLIELETDFLKELTGHHLPDTLIEDTVNREELKETASCLYVKEGSFYLIKDINNNLYYEEKNEKCKLVYQPEHLIESIFNLLLSKYIPGDLTLKLTVQRYGFKKEELEIPFKQWIDYCERKGCKLYAGIKKLDTESVSATVFVVNDIFKYNHVMSVDFPYTLLDSTTGTINGYLMVYIPMHNIQSLFAETNLNNK